jgi:uncharacterized membrane protein YeaQ/YmgE (transglycosylase-associated protein family)
MTIESILTLLVVGAVAGWLADKIMKSGGLGLGVSIVVGIIGAAIGQFVCGLFGITAGGIVGTIVMATVGAAILLFVVGLVKK